jgi:hypothetical protein
MRGRCFDEANKICRRGIDGKSVFKFGVGGFVEGYCNFTLTSNPPCLLCSYYSYTDENKDARSKTRHAKTSPTACAPPKDL